MAIITDYKPTSWEVDNLNWSAPDPTDFRYFAAIREAMLERYEILGLTPGEELLLIRPYHVLSYDALNQIGGLIRNLGRNFLHAEPEDWTPILEAYPVSRAGVLPIGGGKGDTLPSAAAWLISAKEELDGMRYLYLSSKYESHSKSLYGGTASGSRNMTALEQYNAATSSMDESWSNPWQGPYAKEQDMGVEASYLEYYAYYFNNPAWASGNPYWVTANGNSVKCRYTPILRGEVKPDIAVYALVFMRNSATVTIFDPKQAFPDDEIEEDKICRLTNYVLDGNTIDFEPAFGNKPLYPPHSMMDYSIEGSWVQSAGVHHIYTSMVRGVWLSQLRLVGDFHSENGFKFKP